MNTHGDDGLESRIRRLEDLDAIRQLVARYGFAIDDRDLEGVGNCFCRDGAFRSRDGVMQALGREAVLDQFRQRFSVLGPSNHFTHDHVIELDEHDADVATGLVNSHAEVVRNGSPMLVALRYADRYRREDGAWRFADRELSFLYYLKPEDYREAFNGIDRMRAYEQPQPADYPENLPSWRRYHQIPRD